MMYALINVENVKDFQDKYLSDYTGLLKAFYGADKALIRADKDISVSDDDKNSWLITFPSQQELENGPVELVGYGFNFSEFEVEEII